MKMRVKLFGAAFVAILLLCMITILPVARGQPPAPSFWVEPSTESFTTATASVGTQFNVTVCGESSDNTIDWAVRLGFDSSELHAVAGYMSDFFAGHPCVNINPEIDNNAGNVLAAQIITGSDYVGPASGSLFFVTFEIIAAPSPGQSLTSLIDPGYGIASQLTAFTNSSYAPEVPLSTAPCAYTFCDTAACSSNPTYVSCSPNPVVTNSPVTCTAAVSSLNATGTVTWTSNSSTGSFNPPICTLPSGNSSENCATTFTDSSPGTVTITASYSGDADNTPSSASTILVVNAQAEQSSTYIFCSPNPAHVDGNVFCSAEVIGNNPTGSIAWSSNSSTGNFSSSVCTLLSFGRCGTTYRDSSPGTVMISASYSGDSNNTPSNCSTTLLESAQALQSSTYVYCSPNPAHVNGSVTCTTYVNGFNPTGTVTWSSNSSTASFSSSVCDLWYEDCSTTYTDSSPGTVTITASYSGDSDNAPSNGSTTVIESAEPLESSTYVYCWPSPVPVNGSVTCTADVNGFNPTGTVTWSSNSSTGAFSSSLCTLSSGSCATTYNDSSAGTVVITASYSGDTDNTPSNSTTIIAVVQAVPSSTYVYCSLSTVHVNGSVICNAEVSGFNPTGTITWSSNSTTGTFSPSVCTLQYGTCATTYTDSSAGTVVITASYSGDSNNTPSNGSTTVIESAQPLKSSTYVYCWPSPVPVNGSVTCTADVYGFNPTGTVTWSSNSSTGSFSSSVCDLSSGYCLTTYTDSSERTVLITASYSGDSDNTPSNSTTIIVVVQSVPSSTYVYCWPSSVPVNGSVTCNAEVYGFNPTGTVAWSSNSSTGAFSPSVCTLSSGYCSTSYTDSRLGTVTITASYSGDSDNTPSSSSTIIVVVQSVPSSTYVYCSPNPAHVNGSVTCAASVNGFNPTGTVTWSSNSSTGSFSPSVCDLSSGYCSTTYTDSSEGTVVITASYSGDSNNTPSNYSTTLVESAQASQSSTYVYCWANPVHVNESVTLLAEVYGFNPTGTVTWSSNSSTGSFSPSVCDLSSGYCYTTYTDSAAGTVVITASYSGDSDNTPSSSSTTLIESSQAVPSSTYVYCSLSTVHVNGSVTCTAYVNGFNPTGTVTWSSNSSTGAFSPSVCTLSSGYCSTAYTDSSPGTVTITASYSGDSENAPSNGSTTLMESEQAVPSSTYVYCYPNPVHVNGPVSCSAFVSGENPTGTIVWSSNSSTGSFSPSLCALSFGSCGTLYTDSSEGTVLITASYSGDSDNTPSNGSTTLVVSTQAEQSFAYVYSSSSSVYANWPATCNAGVSGFNPTGTVTWSSNSSTGAFSPSVCTLSSGYCSTTYNDSSAGTVVITASYSGDADNTASVGTMTLMVLPEPVLPSNVLINVPYHHQLNGYYCGPAALEEVFDFYGPDVGQGEIASVARTTPGGTYDIDLVRAAEFSNMSNSAEDQSGAKLNGFNGYSSRSLGYAALSCYGMSVEDLRVVLAAGYPVIVLTTWHFRVAVGYDDNCIIFQDPYYGSLYRMTYDAFSTDWDYSGHEGILVCPWQVEISNPRNVLPGVTFNVTATITYPDVYPFQAFQPSSGASWVNATITLPSGLTLATGETAQKACESYFEPGQSFTVSWQVQCKAVDDYKIGVEAEGLVSGNMMAEPPDYPQSYVYQDRIGGTNDSALAVTSALDTTPPITAVRYDGSWQTHPFAINLTASDDESGVLDTYYRINGGPEQTLTLNGQPIIRTPGANNTLEYWSVDWAGNEELPHKLLTNIKLDEAPPSLDSLSFTPYTDVQPYQTVEVTVSATDDLSGIQNVTLVYSVDDGVSWIHLAMTLNQSTLFFEATISGQPIGTLVRLYVEAYDQAGNVATLKNEWYYSAAYQIPPLRVMSVTACAWIYRGQTAYINVTFIDTGDFPEDVWVTLYYNIATDKVVDAYPVQLEVGQIYTLVFPWNTASVPCLNYTLTAVATIPAGNATLVGGTITVRVMGDVNGDGRVDMKDIALVARAFGSNPNSPRWNVAADMNCDGCVDMKDIALVARHFGQHYP